MTTLLHIDASPRGDRSVSRKLSKSFVDQWLAHEPGATIIYWFDKVIRIGKTFTFDLARGDFPLEPIMSGKTLVVLSSRGEFGFGPGGVRETMNHLETHISTCAHYLGVQESHLIAVDYQEFDDERHRQSVADAFAAIPVLVRQCLGIDSPASVAAE